MGYRIYGQAAAVEFRHLNQFYAKPFQNFSGRGFVAWDSVGDDAAQKHEIL
jgi:hypothetical protein